MKTSAGAKKILLLAGVAALAVVLTVFVAAWASLNSLVAIAIREGGTRAMGVRVDVDRVALFPFSGSGSIYGLRVSNPSGYKEPLAIRMGKLHANLDLKKLRQGVVDVRLVEVKEPEIWYERTGARNNFSRIQQQAMGSLGDYSQHGEQLKTL